MCAASKEPRASQVLFGGKDVLKASAGTKLRIDGELSEVLCELAKSSELFLITQTDDDEVERLVVDALETSGVFAAGMNRLHVLFCSTTAGRGSIVRQLEPDTHIDDRNLTMLAQFIPQVVTIAGLLADDSMSPRRCFNESSSMLLPACTAELLTRGGTKLGMYSCGFSTSQGHECRPCDIDDLFFETIPGQISCRLSIEV